MERPHLGFTTPWQRISTGVLFLAVVCLVGEIGYMLAGWGPLDSLYMVVITIFGVGYGEVEPIRSPALQVFTIVLIVSGCSALVYILSGLFQLITEGELNRMMGSRRMTKELDQLSGHVIICGYGRLGQVLAQELSAAGKPYVVVDLDHGRLDQAREAGGVVLEGDASDEDVLLAAGIDRAAALATVLPADAVNVFITLTARQLNTGLNIIARAEQPSTERKLMHAGASRVVLPARISALRIASIIARPEVTEFFTGEHLSSLRGELEPIGIVVRPVEVKPGSPLVGRNIGEIERTGDGGFMVVALHRGDGSTIKNPTREVAMLVGDELLLMGHEEDIPDLESRYRIGTEPSAAEPAAASDP